MKKNGTKKLFGLLMAFCLVAAMLPTAALAAWLEDNSSGNTIDQLAEGDNMDTNEGTVILNNGEINHNRGVIETHNGTMSYNHSTVTTNNGEILENSSGALVETNEGTVSENYGTVAVNNGEVQMNEGTLSVNNGEVEHNYGVIEDNSGGTVFKNYGGTVNGGTVTYDYPYLISIVGLTDISKLSCYDQNGDGNGIEISLDKNTIYATEDAVVVIQAQSGYGFADAPKITAGQGTLAENSDGGYAISDIAGDITLEVQLENISVTDITGVASVIYTGVEADLYQGVAVIPEDASFHIKWEVVDPGTTGAAIDDPYSGILTAAAEGTITVRATIENGLSEGEDYTKDFTIVVKSAVEAVYNAFVPVKTALAGGNIDELKTAASGFEEILDIYDGLEEEQFDQLAEKLGLSSGEAAFNEVFGVWFDTNIVLEMGARYQDYRNISSKEYASKLVEYYKEVFKKFDDEALKTLVRTHIPDIDKVYKDALSDSRSHSYSEGSSSLSSSSTKEEVKNPDTGDSSAMWLGLVAAALSCLAACGAVWFKKRTN